MMPGITDVCPPTTASTRNADAASKVPTVSRATWTAITSVDVAKRAASSAFSCTSKDVTISG